MKEKSGIIFMGTPQMAADCLKRLIRDGRPVKAVFTQPDRPVGRKREITPSPVKSVAKENNIPVYTPESLKTKEVEDIFNELSPKVAIVVAYGKIIPQNLLSIPESFINLHFSLLPLYRGAAPVQRALYDGQTVTGVSIQYLAAKLDAGDIIAEAPFTINPKDTTETLWERSVAIGASLLTRIAAQLLEGRLPATPQDETKVTYAAKMAREDGFIDWTWSARMIHNHIRACNPWPGAVTWRKGKEIKLWGSEWPVPAPGPLGSPGEIITTKKELFVCAIDGFIKITDLQPAGGARQKAEAFVAGLRGEKAFLENKPEDAE